MTAEKRDEVAETLTPAPLFAAHLKPGETCYAEHIRHINIFLVEEDEDGNEVRSRIPKREQAIELKPFKTTEQDIADNYDDGVYWVEAIRAVSEGKDKLPGSKMPGAHPIRVGSQVKNSDDGDDDGGAEPVASPLAMPHVPPAFGQMNPMWQHGYGPMVPQQNQSDTVAAAALTAMQKQSDKMIDVMSSRRGEERSPVKDFVEMASVLHPRQDTPAQIKTLDDTITELRQQLRKLDERSSEALEAERKRSRDALEDAKRDAKRDLERIEKDADARSSDLRDQMKKREREWDDERRRLLSDMDDQRSKYKRESEATSDAHRKELIRADEDFVRYRKNAEERISVLETEVFGYKRSVTELTGRLDVEKLDREHAKRGLEADHDRTKRELEMLKKDLERTKKDAAAIEEELDEAKEELEKASKAGDPPLEGMPGWLLKQLGPNALQQIMSIIPMLTSGQGGPSADAAPEMPAPQPASPPQPSVQRSPARGAQTPSPRVSPVTTPPPPAPAPRAYEAVVDVPADEVDTVAPAQSDTDHIDEVETVVENDDPAPHGIAQEEAGLDQTGS